MGEIKAHLMSTPDHINYIETNKQSKIEDAPVDPPFKPSLIIV